MTRIHSVLRASAAGAPPHHRASFSSAASRCICSGRGRWRIGTAPGRGLPRASRRPAARRAARVSTLGSGSSPPAARGRRRRDCARGWACAVPGSLPARRDDEHVPLRRPRRPCGRVRLHAATARGVSGEALAGAARPFRSRSCHAATASCRARCTSGGSLGLGARASRDGAWTPAIDASAQNRSCLRAPVERRRQASALRARAGAGGTGRADHRRACRARRRGRARARRRGALLPDAGVTEIRRSRRRDARVLEPLGGDPRSAACALRSRRRKR